MAAGDFSATALLDIVYKAEQKWSDSQLLNSKKAQAVAAVVVKQKSTARIDDLSGYQEKDNKVKITWIDDCALVVEDCETNCDISGDEVSTNSQEYVPAKCKKVDFSINAEKMRTNTYTVEEQAAQLLADAVVKLDEWWAQQVLIFLNSNAGDNVDPLPGAYSGNTTTFAAADYTMSKLVPAVVLDGVLNRLNNPYNISNAELWTDFFNAQINAGNADGKGTANLANQLDMNFDLVNFAKAGLTADLFSVSSGAVAFVTTNRNQSTPQVLGGSVNQTRYQVKSSVIPGVFYDVYYSLKCITDSNGKANIVHAWRVETNGDLFLNPKACPVTIGGTTYSNVTGILSYTKGA